MGTAVIILACAAYTLIFLRFALDAMREDLRIMDERIAKHMPSKPDNAGERRAA